MTKYTETTPVIITPQRKSLEFAAFGEVARQCNVTRYAFTKCTLSPMHDALRVEFFSFYRDRSMKVLVEIAVTRRFPHEEPFAVILEPDIRPILRSGTRVHVYDTFEGRHICSHLSEWSSQWSMAGYFRTSIFTWANNLCAYVYTDGAHSPDKWVLSR